MSHFVKIKFSIFQVTDAIKKIADSYECTPIEGMLSYQMKRYQTEADTEKQIVLNPTEAQKKETKNVRNLFYDLIDHMIASFVKIPFCSL